jgi:ankyrin repeat protein
MSSPIRPERKWPQEERARADAADAKGIEERSGQAAQQAMSLTPAAGSTQRTIQASLQGPDPWKALEERLDRTPFATLIREAADVEKEGASKLSDKFTAADTEKVLAAYLQRIQAKYPEIHAGFLDWLKYKVKWKYPDPVLAQMEQAAKPPATLSEAQAFLKLIETHRDRKYRTTWLQSAVTYVAQDRGFFFENTDAAFRDVRRLLSWGIDQREKEHSLLFEAAVEGHNELVKELLAAGADPNLRPGKRGETSLMAAAGERRSFTVLELLNGGADPNITDDMGQTALFHVFEEESVRQMLRCKADPNRPSNDGTTPLIHAVKEWRDGVTRALLTSTALQVNQRDASGWTALMWAAQRESPAMTTLLLAAGADPTLKDPKGRTALGIASKPFVTQPLVEALQRRLREAAPVGKTPVGLESKGQQERVAKADAGDAKGVEQSQAQRAAAEKSKMDALRLVAKSARAQLGPLKTLERRLDQLTFGQLVREAVELEQGGFPALSRTAMGLAVARQDFEKVMAAYKKRIAPLYMEVFEAFRKRLALFERHRDALPANDPVYEALRPLPNVAPSLQEANRFLTLIETHTIQGGTWLMRAVMKNDTATFNNLLRWGVSPNVQTDDGTALQCAVDQSNQGNESLVRQLLAAGADPNFGVMSLLRYAISMGRDSIAQLLLDGGADPNGASRSGSTSLAEAARLGKVGLVTQLIEKGANANRAEFIRGNTALMVATDPTVLQALLAAGAQVNQENLYNRTALFSAAEGGELEKVKLLLLAGADPTIPDCSGKTPLGAAQNGPQEIRRLLQEAEEQRKKS